MTNLIKMYYIYMCVKKIIYGDKVIQWIASGKLKEFSRVNKCFLQFRTADYDQGRCI